MLEYKDTATFVTVTSVGYGNKKQLVEEEDVNCTFLQSTGFVHSNYRDTLDSDAICYPDPNNTFVLENYYRLEGMYIKMNLYDSPDSISWYKVIGVSVNRDHLLENEVDNVLLNLKKTRPIPGVS